MRMTPPHSPQPLGLVFPEPTKFEVELEFVQCLGNPGYVNCKLNL